MPTFKHFFYILLIPTLCLSLIACTEEETKPTSTTVVTTTNTNPKNSAVIKNLHTFFSSNKIGELAITPDGQTAISGSNEISLWNIPSGRLNSTLKINQEIKSFTVSPDNKTLVLGRWDGTIEFWDLQMGKPKGNISGGHTKNVNAVLFTPDGKSLISASEDGFLRIWNLEAGKLEKTLFDQNENSPFLYSINTATLSQNGNLIATSDDTAIKIWDYNTGQIKHTLKNPTDSTQPIKNLAFSSDAKLLAWATSEQVQIWNLDTQKSLKLDLKKPGKNITAIALSPNGKILAIGFSNAKISLWDITNEQPILEDISHSTDPTALIQGLAFNQLGNLLVSGSDDGILKVWQVNFD